MSVKTMSCKTSLNPGQENFCIAYGTLKSYDLCISKEILTGKNFTNSGKHQKNMWWNKATLKTLE